jgi:hypothetical protein
MASIKRIVAKPVELVDDDAQTTRVPVATEITIQRGREAAKVVLDFSRRMNRR